jgi:NADH dehydrogenase
MRILVLGGGFGGVYTAMHLEHRLRHRRDVEITLVNRENFLLFTPMLHEVAASDLDPTHIVSPVRELLRRTTFFCGEVAAIDLDKKIVSVTHGFERHGHELQYDYLVIALGSATNFFHLPGVAEHAITMKSLGDAIHLRNRLIALLEESDTECAAGECGPLMTVVVAGGGFAGIETIAAVNDFLRESLRFYPRIKPELLRLVVVHPGPVILPELGEELGRYAHRKLAARGVEIRTDVKVAEATDVGVTLSDGTHIACRTLIWTAGTSPHPIVGTLPCDCDRGRVRVNEFLEVPKYPGVWALGDCAIVPNVRTGKPHPPTAQHAIREAKTVAGNIAAAILGGGTRRPFLFNSLGQLAAIGRRTGVAKVFGVKFSGFPAWWLWRTIYLSKLPRWEKRIRVAIDWTLDLVFAKDLVQYLTVNAPAVSHRMYDDEEHGHAEPARAASGASKSQSHGAASIQAAGAT